MYFGGAVVMLKRAARRPSGRRSHYLAVFLDDVDAHYLRAKSSGAKITGEVNETCYGERQYGVQDFTENFWLFSKHVQDVSPAGWGASMVQRP